MIPNAKSRSRSAPIALNVRRPAVLALGADGAQQRRLALAGGRLDERDRAAAVTSGIELCAERVQLRFPLQQLGVGDDR